MEIQAVKSHQKNSLVYMVTVTTHIARYEVVEPAVEIKRKIPQRVDIQAVPTTVKTSKAFKAHTSTKSETLAEIAEILSL